jgi:AraC-like DNA-binding protein
MKIENIKTITLEDLKAYTHLTIYMDENIGILNGINPILQRHQNIAKLGCLLIAFCEEGEVLCNINGHQYLLQQDYCAILPPGTIVRPNLSTTSHTIKVAAIGQRFLTDTLSLKKETWNVLHFLSSNPIFPINRASSYKMFLYKELLLALIREESHVYSKQTRRYHFASMVCEMFSLLNKMIPEYQRRNINRSRATYIVRNFIELVNADNGSHRSLNYYADLMCYTNKHLRIIVKKVTGKSPSQFIKENTIKQIKYKLRQSNLSIKELADYFGFPTASFFGKFVKEHIGMSPMQYRMSEVEL